jgi:hypothetical protein
MLPPSPRLDCAATADTAIEGLPLDDTRRLARIDRLLNDTNSPAPARRR